MQLGMIGLGRMGANIVRRLMRDGHTCVVYDVSPDAVAALEAEGATGATTLDDFVAKLDAPRRAWVMVPAGEITETTVREIAARLSDGDTVIDGGNSYYRDDIRRAAELAERGIDYLDCGTSGGVFGLERGFCLMIGGPDDAFASARADLRVARPRRRRGVSGRPAARASRPRRRRVPPLRTGRRRALREDGPQRHRVRDDGRARRRASTSSTTPTPACGSGTRTPRRRRSSIPSSTPTLSTSPRSARSGGAGASSSRGCSISPRPRCRSHPTLDDFAGRVSDSGEGRWTAIAAIEEGVPADVLTAALYSRFSSRDEGLFANKVLSAMRKEFGGHHEKPAP